MENKRARASSVRKQAFPLQMRLLLFIIMNPERCTAFKWLKIKFHGRKDEEKLSTMHIVFETRDFIVMETNRQFYLFAHLWLRVIY